MPDIARATHGSDPSNRRRVLRHAVQQGDVIVMYMAVAAALSLHLGQDMNWDLRNYHLYNPYQLLTGRFDTDIAAAGIQSYINPLLDLPFYVAVKIFGVWPPLVGLALGALHGVNLWLVHAITVSLFSFRRRLAAFCAGVGAAMTAAFGAGFYSEIGSTMGDNLVSLPVLAAVLVFVRGATASPSARPLRSASIAGLLMGTAVGAKLTAAVYGLALGAAGITIRRPISERLSWLSRYAVLAIGGVVLAGGYWSWLMVKHFGSPLFPFYNAIFRSSLAPAMNVMDERFLPGTGWEMVLYPFLFVVPQQLVSELVFADARLATGLVVTLAIGAQASVCWWKCGSIADTALSRLGAVAAFWLIAYTLWLRTFSIYRYAIPLELLTPALVVASFSYWVSDARKAAVLIGTVCVALILGTKSPDWTRLPWSGSYFGVSEQQLSKYAGATVLMSDMPSAYLAPFFPASARFLRIRDAWHLETDDSMLRQRLQRETRSTDTNRMFVLETSPFAEIEEKKAALSRLGLRLNPDRCATIITTAEQSRICGVSRSQ